MNLDTENITGTREYRDLLAKLAATKAVLAERERELLELKGPCSGSCRLHYAHSGPCDIKPTGPLAYETTKAIEKHLRILGYRYPSVEWDGALAAARAFAEAPARCTRELDVEPTGAPDEDICLGEIDARTGCCRTCGRDYGRARTEDTAEEVS